MGNITVSWLEAKPSVILATFPVEGWTWQDLTQILKKQYALIDSVDLPVVDVLVDVRNSDFMPKAQSLLSVVRAVLRERHPRQGKLVIVGASTFILSVAKVVSRLSGGELKLYLVASMEEAYVILDIHTIPPSAATANR
jgi:hypothetical protein